MSPTPDSALREASGLCADCESLRFDDEGCGGFMGASDMGTPMLKFTRESVMKLPPGVFKLLMPQQRTDSFPDFPTLAKSAAVGCGFCGFLCAAFLRANIQGLGSQEKVSIFLVYAWGFRAWAKSDEEGLQALVAEVYNAQNRVVCTLHFSVYSHTGQVDATADWLGLHAPPWPETLCPENVSFLQHALESCSTDCHPPPKTSFFPTRLLDIGTAPDTHPRLVITADLISAAGNTEPIRYAALSYCWGNKADASSQTKTEPSNLHDRLRAIPTHNMSAVMQDAIAVCRALSVRYVWIDALCIIQDPADPSDWERESEHVGQVFQHAYFTICAISMPSCHQSFLARSQHTFDFDFQSSLHMPARGRYTLHSTGQYNWEPLHDLLSRDLAHSPWRDRGWVYQEDLLSPRKLLFGQHMVHFECSRNQLSENGETYSGQGGVDWSFRTSPTREEVYEGFRGATAGYSSSHLSYESDRLPALAGLVKQVFGLVGGKYLAGLWMEDLHAGLLWEGAGRKQKFAEHFNSLQASSGSGAPSWSWVSQPGYISYNFLYDLSIDQHLRAEYTNIDGWTTLKGAQLNQFGEVGSGKICIRSKVLPMPADSELQPRPGRRHALLGGPLHRAVIASCYLDWIQTSRKAPGRLELLLLSSWRDTQEDKEEDGEGKENDGNGEEDDGEDGGERAKGEYNESEYNDSEYNESEYEEISENEDERNVSQEVPSEAGVDSLSTASEDGHLCVLYDDKGQNRHVMGLIIQPTEKTGEYYRVGVFRSLAGEEGGAQLFRGLEDVCIYIV